MRSILASRGLATLLVMRPVLAASRVTSPLATRSMHLLRPAVSQLPRVTMGAVRMQSGGPDRTVVDTCKAKISAAIDVKELDIQGAYDDPNGSHITIYCVAEAFEGKRSLARQQMVFKAIWEEMQGPVHAVDTMTLKAPSEVE